MSETEPTLIEISHVFFHQDRLGALIFFFIANSEEKTTLLEMIVGMGNIPETQDKDFFQTIDLLIKTQLVKEIEGNYSLTDNGRALMTIFKLLTEPR